MSPRPRIGITRRRAPRSELVLRCDWLRTTGDQMLEVEPTGQLSNALWDFADLLEALDRQGLSASDG